MTSGDDCHYACRYNCVASRDLQQRADAVIRRKTAVVEFGRAELPVDDDRIKLRMLASLDVRPGDKVLTARISQREHTRKERTSIENRQHRVRRRPSEDRAPCLWPAWRPSPMKLKPHQHRKGGPEPEEPGGEGNEPRRQEVPPWHSETIRRPSGPRREESRPRKLKPHQHRRTAHRLKELAEIAVDPQEKKSRLRQGGAIRTLADLAEKRQQRADSCNALLFFFELRPRRNCLVSSMHCDLCR